MSLPEVLLWQILRKRPEGLKFRHEHPTGEFSLDFYCSDARLAVEVDGEARARLPLHRPADGSPPRDELGED